MSCLVKMENNLMFQSHIISDSIFKEYQMTVNQHVMTKFGITVKGVEGTKLIYKSIEEIQEQMKLERSAQEDNRQGRGGNNVAENMKKSVLSIFKKMLSKEAYAYFEEKLIKQYELKSQKENFVLFIMFLRVLQKENLVSYPLIKAVLSQIQTKIGRYIENSRVRVRKEKDREEFHLKNIAQFQKYLRLDLQRIMDSDYGELCEKIRPFYLRKQVIFDLAAKKILRVIEENVVLREIYLPAKKQSTSINDSSYR